MKEELWALVITPLIGDKESLLKKRYELFKNLSHLIHRTFVNQPLNSAKMC